MARLSGKQLRRMIDQALQKEEETWKVMELNPKTDSCITYKHRTDIIKWIHEVAKKFQFYPEAPALAVALLDKFLTTVKAQIKYLKCIAITCLHIACKMTEEDEMVPHVAELVSLASANCSTDEIVRMEKLILTKLDWSVNLATPLHFLQVCHAYLIKLCPNLFSTVPYMTAEAQLGFLTHKLWLWMMSPEANLFCSNSTAVCVLSLELEEFRPDWFPLTLDLLRFIEYEKCSELIVCKEKISFTLMMAVNSNQRARQHKRTRHYTNSECKRKMVDLSVPDQEEIYTSIKVLYEEGNEEIVEISAVIVHEE